MDNSKPNDSLRNVKIHNYIPYGRVRFNRNGEYKSHAATVEIEFRLLKKIPEKAGLQRNTA